MDVPVPPTAAIVLILIALASGLICHWRIRSFWLASIAGAFGTVALFFGVCLIRDGMPYPLDTRALGLFSVFGFIVSALAGGLLRTARAVIPRRA